MKRTDKQLKLAEFFAGVGGIGLAFERFGCQTIFANDSDKYCKQTYDANHWECPMTLGDIVDIIPLVPPHDILLAGFPCQPFSVMGWRQGFDDERGRGNLFLYLADIISTHRPQAFVLENVRNLVSHDGGKTFAIIMKTLREDLGYFVKWQILSSHKHGDIPQNRERIFIVGFRDEEAYDKFEFPPEIPLTVKFTDLLEENVSARHYYTESSPLYPHLLKAVTRMDTMYQYRRVGVVRENKSNMCPTLLSSFGMGGNTVPIINDGKGFRKLTVRECFRLQAYPDWFELPSSVSQSQLYKQVGNSVTISVVQRLAEQVLIALG